MLALMVEPPSVPVPLERAPPWFALRVIGDPALRVIPLFKQLGVETYYPVVREMRAVLRRKLSHAQRNSGVTIMRQRDVPFLPGVVFTRMRPGYPRQDDIFERTKILGFLCFGDKPAAIPQRALDELRGREIDGVIAGRTPARMIFKVGEQVRVSHGAFTSFHGIVIEVPDVAIEDIDPDTRLKLTMDIFGRATSLELAAWQIEKL